MQSACGNVCFRCGTNLLAQKNLFKKYFIFQETDKLFNREWGMYFIVISLFYKKPMFIMLNQRDLAERYSQ